MRVVVAGAGPAAHRFAGQLRLRGHQGPVTVLGEEPVAPYNRALLGSVLDGTLRPGQLALPSLPDGVLLRTGTRVTAVDRARKVVRTDGGDHVPYDVLVLATGSRPNVPNTAGLLSARGRLAEAVRTLRTAADCGPLPDEPVVVLGGGVLGVESAVMLRRAGHTVTLVHPHRHLMERQLDADAGTLLGNWVGALGVTVRTGRSGAEYAPGKLVLDDGEVLEAGTLLVCTGARPDTELAQACGLSVREGVLVDELLCTDDPFIHAIGDCAELAGQSFGSVGRVWEQADALARVLTGDASACRPARRVVRPRIPGQDLVALGEAGSAPATEHVSLTDRTRGRYARLSLRGDRIAHGVLFGLSHAVAAVSQLYDRDLPVPADRLALLAGTDGSYADRAELPDEAVVCHCNNVTKKDLTDAWHCGAHGLPQLAAATRATTGCAGCTSVVRALCSALEKTATVGDEPVEERIAS
ncbi:FAD-dependent oxidoreductase [Streptomyces sp. NPDC051956]|uniref:FAD-dependent oxidoreductase n=1 Tax=Streptomyces sp. NPDC051956 TaxID=3365677 RepID=UPI0037CF2363